MLNREKINKEMDYCIRSMRKGGLKPNLNNLLFEHVGCSEWTYFDELSHRICEKNQGDILNNQQIMKIINIFLELVKRN